MRGIGRAERAISALQSSYVRWHARGLSLRRSRWSALVRSAVLLLISVLFVVAVAQEPAADCPVAGDVDVPALDADQVVIVSGGVLWILAWWLVAIAAAVVAIRRVVRAGQRRSQWTYANWHRRIQGAVASTVGKVLLVFTLLALLAPVALGHCEVPEWFAVLVSCAVLAGLLLTVFGSAVATEAGWVGFALVVIIDLLSAALLYGYAVLDPEGGRSALVGVAAFTVHAICTAVACRWSYIVASIPGTQPDDRAKAGETGRSLCALWVLLLIASIIVIFNEDLLTAATSILTSPVVVALTLGALAVTLGSGHTKYVEAREAARRRAVDRRSSRKRTLDRRDDLVPRIAARMIAACGPLPIHDLADGINRVAPFPLNDRQMHKELVASDLLRHAAETWDLAAGIDPARHAWPTDRRLQRLAADLRHHQLDRAEIDGMLDQAGYRGLNSSGYLRDNHPLVRPVGSRPTRRWTVLRRSDEP